MIISESCRALALSLGLALVPSAAYAVNVSANDGFGYQEGRSDIYFGSNVNGELRSTGGGKNVYYSGKVARGGCTDNDIGRYSTNTNSTVAMPRGGKIQAAPECSYQGVKSRVCTVRSGIPDACGSDSATYARS